MADLTALVHLLDDRQKELLNFTRTPAKLLEEQPKSALLDFESASQSLDSSLAQTVEIW
jgi:hypothetical protein